MNSAERYLKVSPSVGYQALARDEYLLFAARGGSHEAFAELQKMYSQRLFRRILSITRNREDAEDALQDTFLRAYLALPSFEGRSRFSSWLTSIAINSALMIIRRRRSRPETPFEQHSGYGDDSRPIDVRDNALNPEQLCDQEQRFCAMVSAIRQLDPKFRTPLSLWLSQDYSLKDLAQELGISLASLKGRLRRARMRLLRSSVLRHPGMESSAGHC
jgi:RNA polymerase sigma-70 factor (ECF subfamily)